MGSERKRDKMKGRYGATYQQAVRLVEDFFATHIFAKTEENVARMTPVAEDVAFANELMCSDEFRFERALLWKAVERCEEIDGVIAPSALKTDFRREINANYRDEDGFVPLDARCFRGRYASDHVVTVLVRYIISEDPGYYREYFQVNHANCDLLLCSMFPKKFEWLLDERMQETELFVEGSPWVNLSNRRNQLTIDYEFDGDGGYE